ncbi:MAG: 2-amino-4-hydroxy-6-hydroxymethyldihydropteridine diphosphokinase [Bacteroidota bacterium]
MKRQKVILLFGGNEGNTARIFSEAENKIQCNIGRIINKSRFYQTGAWGPVPQQDYLNCAIVIETIFSPLIVLEKILAIELQMGRKRTVKYGPRIIDIDMLFYGTLEMQHPKLIIPHPHIAERRFVLVPCFDIIPQFIHPVYNQTIANLLMNCKDKLAVNVWKQ